ncbi:hypothetical protein D3C72_1142990 [compost metagenome]
MRFLGLEDVFEHVTRAEVASGFAMGDGCFQVDQAFLFDLQVAFEHFLGVLANQQLAQVLDVGDAFEEENTLDQFVSVLHLVDGFLVLVLAEFVQAPIFVHACVQEVLVDRDQLVSEDLVEMLDDAYVAFHVGFLPCRSVPIQGSLSPILRCVKPKFLNNK